MVLVWAHQRQLGPLYVTPHPRELPQRPVVTRPTVNVAATPQCHGPMSRASSVFHLAGFCDSVPCHDVARWWAPPLHLLPAFLTFNPPRKGFSGTMTIRATCDDVGFREIMASNVVVVVLGFGNGCLTLEGQVIFPIIVASFSPLSSPISNTVECIAPLRRTSWLGLGLS